jgi:hypothetical protein
MKNKIIAFNLPVYDSPGRASSSGEGESFFDIHSAQPKKDYPDTLFQDRTIIYLEENTDVVKRDNQININNQNKVYLEKLDSGKILIKGFHDNSNNYILRNGKKIRITTKENILRDGDYIFITGRKPLFYQNSTLKEFSKENQNINAKIISNNENFRKSTSPMELLETDNVIYLANHSELFTNTPSRDNGKFIIGKFANGTYNIMHLDNKEAYILRNGQYGTVAK